MFVNNPEARLISSLRVKVVSFLQSPWTKRWWKKRFNAAAVGQFRDCVHVGRAHHSLVMRPKKSAGALLAKLRRRCVRGSGVEGGGIKAARAPPTLASCALLCLWLHMGKVCSISTVANAERRAQKGCNYARVRKIIWLPRQPSDRYNFHHCARTQKTCVQKGLRFFTKMVLFHEQTLIFL
jgi:hypothetical protein